MAKVLKEIFSASDKINQTYTIHSWHVSQSVDALTGADDYDITISGSLTVTGSVYLDGTPNINSNANTVLVLDTSNNQVKYGPDISTFSGGSADTGSLLTTASLSGTNLTFTKGDDSTFSITLPTGGDASTGSLLTTASIDGGDLIFTKGDGSTFSISIPETQSLQDVTGIENRTSSSIQIGPGDPNGAITKDGLYYLDIGSNISGVSANAGNSIYAGSKYNIINGGVNSIYGYASIISGLTNYSHTNTSSSIAVGRNNRLGYSTYGAVVNAAAFGFGAYAYGDQSLAQGNNVEARGDNSHAQGSETLASGTNSHAEGFQTTASNTRAHSEGYGTTASGQQSHAEGYNSIASGQSSHAEGETTTASGWGAHAEGSGSNASGSFSHAEGYRTSADQLSHAEGIHTIAWGVQTFPTTDRWATGPYNPIPGLSGSGEHLEGAQLVIGRYNEPKNDQLFIIGNGVSEEDRTNIMEVSLTDVNFYYPITSSADISSSGDITVNNLTVNASFTASIISASSIIGDITASAAGNDTEIQFNDGGVFGASSNLTWDNTNQVLKVKGGTGAYPSIWLETTDTSPSVGDVLGRLESYNNTMGGGTYNSALKFVVDKNWSGGSYSSRIEFQTVDTLTEATQLLISSSGQLKFNSYGSDTFTGTPSTYLAADSNGNIIEVTNLITSAETSSFIDGSNGFTRTNATAIEFSLDESPAGYSIILSGTPTTGQISMAATPGTTGTIQIATGSASGQYDYLFTEQMENGSTVRIRKGVSDYTFTVSSVSLVSNYIVINYSSRTGTGTYTAGTVDDFEVDIDYYRYELSKGYTGLQITNRSDTNAKPFVITPDTSFEPGDEAILEVYNIGGVQTKYQYFYNAFNDTGKRSFYNGSGTEMTVGNTGTSLLKVMYWEQSGTLYGFVPLISEIVIDP